MDYEQLSRWLSKLSDEDRKYLEKHPSWKRERLQAEKSGTVPRGFIELTMEILENGSESET